MVGERETVVDPDVVTWYGKSIVDVTETVRDNVVQRVQEAIGQAREHVSGALERISVTSDITPAAVDVTVLPTAKAAARVR